MNECILEVFLFPPKARKVHTPIPPKQRKRKKAFLGTYHQTFCRKELPPEDEKFCLNLCSNT